MKISFILYVFQFFIKNQHLTSHGIMYVFVDFLNFSNLTFHGIMYVFADFREKNFFTYFTFFYLPFVLPVSSIPVVCIINTCITYDLTRLRCMNHLSASCVDSHMSSEYHMPDVPGIQDLNNQHHFPKYRSIHKELQGMLLLHLK